MRRARRRLVFPAALLAAATASATIAATGCPAAGAASPKPRVAVVLDEGPCPNQDTPNQDPLRLCEGIGRAMRATGVRARIVAPTVREDLVDFLSLLARQPYDAVVLWGLYYRPAVAVVARRYPKMPFVVVDAPRSEVQNAPKNVHGLVLQTREAAFLAGWLAAKLEARRPGRDVVGVVGGIPVPGVTTFVDGFRAGAKRAVPGATVLVHYSGDFVDPAKCAALARKQIARGAGMVFDVAGACGLGAMEAAADAGIWAVGVDTDQSFLGPHVLTSVLKSYEAGFAEVFRQVKAGRLGPGRDTVLTIRDGAAGLGKISPRVPRQLVAQVEELRRRIVSGDLRVPPRPAR
jgi:basic membrane protein A and related proteins